MNVFKEENIAENIAENIRKHSNVLIYFLNFKSKLDRSNMPATIP